MMPPVSRASPSLLAADSTTRIDTLVGYGRHAEAVELLGIAVALRPRDAEAYRLLGGLLGEQWEQKTRPRTTDFGVHEPVQEIELRARAVDALVHSVRLEPSALVHAAIGNMLTPNGRGATVDDMQLAAEHLELAIGLEPSAHSGSIDAAQRMCFQRHLLICDEEATAEAERSADESLISADARMGEEACAAYRIWGRLQPQHGEARAILHFDCGRRLLRPRPRVPEMPIEAIASLRQLQANPAMPELANALFSRHGVAVFEDLLPADLCRALAAELLVNGTRQQRQVFHGRLRSDTVGAPNDAMLRWNREQSPSHGAVGELVQQLVQRLGGFLSSALGGPADEMQLLECASIVTYPGAPAQTWHADSDIHNVCEATVAVLQIQLVDMDAALGPMEVRPFVPLDAEQVELPMLLRAGSVVAYDAKVWHRGGANTGAQPRPVLYTSWMARDDGLLPRNLGYTLPAGDVGAWTLGRLRAQTPARTGAVGRAVQIEVSKLG